MGWLFFQGYSLGQKFHHSSLKGDGGLEIRTRTLINKSFLMKKVWSIFSQPHNLLSKVLNTMSPSPLFPKARGHTFRSHSWGLKVLPMRNYYLIKDAIGRLVMVTIIVCLIHGFTMLFQRLTLQSLYIKLNLLWLVNLLLWILVLNATLLWYYNFVVLKLLRIFYARCFPNMMKKMLWCRIIINLVRLLLKVAMLLSLPVNRTKMLINIIFLPFIS